MKTPLEFNRSSQTLIWKNGTRLPIPDVGETYIDEGVIPVGATWARLPIPFIAGGHDGCDPIYNDPNATVLSGARTPPALLLRPRLP